MTLPQKFSVYMMASYLYYKCNESPLTDHEFDGICVDLLAGWEQFEHIHKHLTTPFDLSAGTGYAIKFPLRVQLAAWDWFNERKQMGAI